jgi:hypothetical protein
LEFFQTQRRQSLYLLIQVEISERKMRLNVQCFFSVFDSYKRQSVLLSVSLAKCWDSQANQIRFSTSLLTTDSVTNKTNSMVWVRERTIPTERPPLVGEVIANFCQ